MSVCAADGGGSSPVPCAAGSSCVGGMCAGWICSPGSRRCVGAGAVETCRADGLGYGASTACAVPANATAATCAGGLCGFTCAGEYADCDGAAANGCETDTRTSAASCGRCGAACPGAPNASPTCASGLCGVSCAAGFANCDGLASNGCESALSSASNCGRCGNACPSIANGSASCASGTCGLRCNSGYNLCRGTCAANVATETCNGVDDDCDGVTDEGCGVGSCASPFIAPPDGGRFTGNMNGRGTQSATCGSSYNSGGVERIWSWIPLRSGTANIRLTGDFWPATLYVRQGVCATGSQIACNSQTGTWPTETVTFAVTAGTTYFVLVDCHYNGTTYNPRYDLTITAP
ncbi:MAG: hypothetical protein KA978_09145 [Deltaproteobacteria bacterium]|nr:hypothetical protein [Deltaproteobacteria bacterium]MBP6830939.1 hypothetical protein [Deltaproteobacteria bacterium]